MRRSLFRTIILASLALWGIITLSSHTITSTPVYQALEPTGAQRLPLAPHTIQMTPLDSRSVSNVNTPPRRLLFKILDKHTLRIHQYTASIGETIAMPWQGRLTVLSYSAHLRIREGRVEEGPKQHINPAVWLRLEDRDHTILHEGWFFSRDPALTAWDNSRFDLVFLGAAP